MRLNDRDVDCQAKNTKAIGAGSRGGTFRRSVRPRGWALNGCTVATAENFSWFGMSSAVRRRTPGALAPKPHTPVIA